MQQSCPHINFATISTTWIATWIHEEKTTTFIDLSFVLVNHYGVNFPCKNLDNMLLLTVGITWHALLYKESLKIAICNTCFESLRINNINGPPQFASTNGLYMGILPEKLCSPLRTKFAIAALAQSNVWLSVVKARRNHVLCSHTNAFAATSAPLALFLPTNIVAL